MMFSNLKRKQFKSHWIVLPCFSAVNTLVFFNTCIVVNQFNVGLCLFFMQSAIEFMFSWSYFDRSSPFAKVCLSDPFVISHIVLCHEQCGSKKDTFTPAWSVSCLWIDISLPWSYVILCRNCVCTTCLSYILKAFYIDTVVVFSFCKATPTMYFDLRAHPLQNEEPWPVITPTGVTWRLPDCHF